MNAITDNEYMYINSLLNAGYAPENPMDDLFLIRKMMFPINGQIGYEGHDYRVFLANQTLDKPAPKRYVFKQHKDNPRQEAMDSLFNAAFKTDPKRIIAAAEKIEQVSFYSPWKKAFVIDLPKSASTVLSIRVIKVALLVATFAVAVVGFAWLNTASSVFLQNTLIPFIASQAPEQAAFISACAIPIFNYVKKRAFVFFLGAWRVSSFTQAMLEAPDLQFRSFVTMVNKVASVVRSAAWAIMFPHRTAWPMILINSVSVLVPAEETFNSIRGALRNQAASAEEDRLRICKEKAYAVFMRIVEKTTPVAHSMENIA